MFVERNLVHINKRAVNLNLTLWYKFVAGSVQKACFLTVNVYADWQNYNGL